VLVAAAGRHGWPAAEAVALFPMVILVGMVERFWTLEEEDGTTASFRTLLSTLLVAGCISLVVGRPAVARLLLACPEALGLVMAKQLLMGPHTGYLLLELQPLPENTTSPAPALHHYYDRTK